MKANYWNQAAPDADDAALVDAIARGVVPPGCLWGGPLVAHVEARGEIPCGACPCPARERCGGSAEMKPALPDRRARPEVERSSEAETRRLERAGWLRELRSLMGED